MFRPCSSGSRIFNLKNIQYIWEVVTTLSPGDSPWCQCRWSRVDPGRWWEELSLCGNTVQAGCDTRTVIHSVTIRDYPGKPSWDPLNIVLKSAKRAYKEKYLGPFDIQKLCQIGLRNGANPTSVSFFLKMLIVKTGHSSSFLLKKYQTCTI